jgi:hypothetical protein
MSYELDISSETTKTASDLLPNQAMIVVDAVTNRAKLIAKDSAGDAFEMNFMPASGTFIADPSGGGTVDTQARTAIAAILNLLITAGLMDAS